MTDPNSDPCPPPAGGHGRSPRVAPDTIGRDGTWPMPPGSGPCRTWPLEPGCGCLAPGDTGQAWGGAATWTSDQQRAVEVATELLWRWTGQHYGLCQEIIRPCRRCSCDRCTGPVPVHTPDGWFNSTCTRCSAREPCGCTELPEIDLPGPVYWEPLTQPPRWDQQYRPADKPPDLATDSATPRYRLIVWIDGHVLLEPGWPLEWQPGDDTVPDPYTPARGDYWLYDRDRLVRIDGGSWPACQDLSRPLQAREAYPDEALGTFGIQYWRGVPVPPGGRRAVSILACELWKACQDDPSCKLPRGVQSITREGVQYEMLQQGSGMLDYLPDVADWVKTVNPADIRSKPRLASPDLPRNRTEWRSGGRMRP